MKSRYVIFPTYSFKKIDGIVTKVAETVGAIIHTFQNHGAEAPPGLLPQHEDSGRLAHREVL